MNDKQVEAAIDGVLKESKTLPQVGNRPGKKTLCENFGGDVIDLPETGKKSSGIKKSHHQYLQYDNCFQPVGPMVLVDKLEPCAYEIATMPLRFVKTEARSDELYLFEGSKMHDVIAEIKKFWTLKDNFDKLGLLHNRGILMYGPPGTGKSACIQQVSEAMIAQGDTVIIAKSLHPVLQALPAFREIEEGRRVVVVFEDMDEYIGYDERNMLQLLDGSSAVDNVLFLGTTNYIERFPARLLRPGRFDKKVGINFPPMEGRKVYLQKKLKGLETDEKIEQLARNTAGFSFGHLRELIIAGYAFGEETGKVIERLKGTGYEVLPERSDDLIENLSKFRKTNVLKG